MKWTPKQIKQLVEKYPYLKPINVWTGKEFEDYDYSYYRGDTYELPVGWSKLFLLMIKDIDPYLKKSNIVDKFYFTQIKEKYGTMRAYTSCSPEIVNTIIGLYESYSKYVCFMCGKPTKYETRGWVEYVCENCIPKTHIENCYKVIHKSVATFETYSPTEGETRSQFSYRPIRTKLNKVRNMTDEEFFNYMIED